MIVNCKRDLSSRAVDPPGRLTNPSLCALCGNHETLRKSHIVPKFWFKIIKGNLKKMYVVARNGINVAKYFQDGPKTHLLCDRCEGFINEEYEKYFTEVWSIKPVRPEPLPDGVIQFHIPDHGRFKLFHLSVLWRAAAAAAREKSYGELSPWRHVDLGASEARIRKMIINGDSGSDHEFPISGSFQVSPDKPNQFIPGQFLTPTTMTLFGSRVFIFVFAGVKWMYFLTNVPSHPIMTIQLQPNGEFRSVKHSFLDDENAMDTAGEWFVREGKMSPEALNNLRVSWSKPRRDDLCPCASGMSFKDCHGFGRT